MSSPWVFLLLGLLAAVASCARPDAHWHRQGETEAHRSRDVGACVTEAEGDAERFERCMRAKGWVWTGAEPPPMRAPDVGSIRRLPGR